MRHLPARGQFRVARDSLGHAGLGNLASGSARAGSCLQCAGRATGQLSRKAAWISLVKTTCFSQRSASRALHLFSAPSASVWRRSWFKPLFEVKLQFNLLLPCRFQSQDDSSILGKKLLLNQLESCIVHYTWQLQLEKYATSQHKSRTWSTLWQLKCS